MFHGGGGEKGGKRQVWETKSSTKQRFLDQRGSKSPKSSRMKGPEREGSLLQIPDILAQEMIPSKIQVTFHNTKCFLIF